jgi:hypothetical protein
MKNKKSAGQVIWLVVIMAFLLIFLLVYSGALGKLFGNLFTGANQQAEGVDDKDGDGIANFIDKCPCNSGDIDNNGCSIGHKITGDEDRSCLNS